MSATAEGASPENTKPEDAKPPSAWPLSREVFAWLKLRTFTTCAALSDEQKRRWREPMQAFTQEWGRTTVFVFKLVVAFLMLTGAGAITATWALTARLVQALLPGPGEVVTPLWVRLLAILVAFNLLVVFPFVAKRISLLGGRGTRGWIRWSLFVAVTCALLVWRAAHVAEAPSPSHLTFLISPGVLAASGWAFLLATGVLVEWIDVRVARTSPQAHAAICLLDVLEAASPEAAWRDISGRWKVVHQLEAAARALERGLLSDTTDARTNAWTQRAAVQVAHAVRRLKRDVLLPRQATREAVLAHVAGLLEKVMEGRWGELPRLKPAAADRVSWRGRLLSAGRLLTSALIPAGVLWAAKAYPNLASLPGATYVLSACVVWFLLSLLVAVDPGVSERLRFARQLSGIFTHRGGAEDK